MSEVVIVTCAHCNGTGTCNAGYRSSSCRSCQEAKGIPDPWNTRYVACAECHGSGKQRL